MADVLSVLGVTIAIFDQLIRLGERTAELASDIRAFDEVERTHRIFLLLKARLIFDIRTQGSSTQT